MYVGLHFPRNKKARHRHRHSKSEKQRTNIEANENNSAKPATPPSQRVHFILGENAYDIDDNDHKPHDIFCQMDELKTTGEFEQEWKETARWIKFEELVEEGAEKWSKPHVASLSLHSLFELRKGITSGTVLLDTSGDNLQDVINLVLDSMISSNQLDIDNRQAVYDVLMCRHKHQHAGQQGLPLIRSLADIGKRHSEKKVDEAKDESKSHNLAAKDGAELTHAASTQSHKLNTHFMKKIPPGAEASNILVGEVTFLKTPIIAFVRLAKSIMLGDLTEVPIPTRFLFILLGPEGHQSDYHEIGRSIATLMSDEVFHDVAYKAKSREDLLSGIDEFLDQVTVLPPGEWDPAIRIEPPNSVPSQNSRKGPNGLGGTNGEDEEESHCDSTLVRTGRLFGGLKADLRRKVPWYWSDFKDCLHVQCLASFFFMYFACLTPIVTFGGLLDSSTDHNLGVMESIVAAAINGITYHFFAGQPLTIIGSTGPVLVFETITITLCQALGWNFLSFRFWIGLWAFGFLTLIVAFDLSSLVRYITRFTEESFAALIAAIFIYEAFHKVLDFKKEFTINFSDDKLCQCTSNSTSNSTDFSLRNITSEENCLNNNGTLVGPACSYDDNIFFLSVLLFLGTFTLAITLKSLRSSRFFPQRIRMIISDFSVFLSIVTFVGIDAYMGMNTKKLNVPTTFKPTRNDRGWFIMPFQENPWWSSLAAAVPAALATILLFMDQQITAVIVNRKENKLLKGAGYHLDLLIIAIQVGLCSIMGLPWFVAATVLSITHVRSLTKESSCAAPGEKPRFIGVREQRVTGIMVFLFVGLAIFMTKILNFIPLAILYGVFLYMGVTSLKGVQLVQRIMIIFMPPKYMPDYMFLRHVRLSRVHIFTAVQVSCFVLLWVIKKTEYVSITFPLMVMAMCFVRKLLDFVFTRKELIWLDDIMPETHKREKQEKKLSLMREQIELTGDIIVDSKVGEKEQADVNEIAVTTDDGAGDHPLSTLLGTFRKRSSTIDRQRNKSAEKQNLLSHTPAIVVDPPSDSKAGPVNV